MQQINLFRARFRREQAVLPGALLVKIAAAAAAAMLLVVLFLAWRTSALRSEFAELERQQAEAHRSLEEVGRRFISRAGDPRLLDEVTKLEALVNSPDVVLQALQRDVFGAKQGYSNFLVALARQNVPGVWLTHVHIVGAGRQVELRGRAVSPERVPRYLQRLSNERSLAGLEFDVFQLGQPKADSNEPPTEGAPRPVRPEKGVVEFVLRTQREVPTTAQAGAP
jgi:Tfp pilus assembly protein PilN